MARRSPWEQRREAIQRIVDENKTDAEIGAVFEVSGASICRVRKELGIAKAPRKTTGDQGRANLLGTAPEALVGTTYVDEAGLTVTRYPARYAAGCFVEAYTARPRRG